MPGLCHFSRSFKVALANRMTAIAKRTRESWYPDPPFFEQVDNIGQKSSPKDGQTSKNTACPTLLLRLDVCFINREWPRGKRVF
jgi:hypothetical protein